MKISLLKVSCFVSVLKNCASWKHLNVEIKQLNWGDFKSICKYSMHAVQW